MTVVGLEEDSLPDDGDGSDGVGVSEIVEVGHGKSDGSFGVVVENNSGIICSEMEMYNDEDNMKIKMMKMITSSRIR